MTPLIVLATIGIIAQLSNGAAPTAYLVTLVAMLFTAYSYGRMASVHYRTAGSAYTYVGNEMGPRLGFLTGWLILLDYFFIPLAVWLIGAAFHTPRQRDPEVQDGRRGRSQGQQERQHRDHQDRDRRRVG